MCIYYTCIYIYIYYIRVFCIYFKTICWFITNISKNEYWVLSTIFSRYAQQNCFQDQPLPPVASCGHSYGGEIHPLGASLIIRANTKLRGWIVFPETFQPVLGPWKIIGRHLPQFWKRIVFQPPIFQGQKRYVFRECRGWIIAQHLILLLWNL